MLNLDPAKLLIIAVVAIILLGPDRLPQLARQVGGAWRTFNEYRHRVESEVRSSIPDLPSSTEIARLARSPSALLNHLSSMSAENQHPAGISSSGDATSPPDFPPEAGVLSESDISRPDLTPDLARLRRADLRDGARLEGSPSSDPTLN